MNSVYFNGRWVTHPGAYSTINADAMTAVNEEGQRVLALIGESNGGEPGEVMFFDDPEVAKKVLRGGELLRAAQKAWAPTINNQGANLIATIRSNEAVQSKLELNDGLPVPSTVGKVTPRVSAQTTGELKASGIYSGLTDNQLMVNITSLGATEIPQGLAASIGQVQATTAADTTGSVKLAGTYTGVANDVLDIRISGESKTTVVSPTDVHPVGFGANRNNINTTTTGETVFDGSYTGTIDDTLQIRISSPNGTIVNNPDNIKPSSIGATNPGIVNPATTGSMVISGTYTGTLHDNFQVRMINNVDVVDPTTVSPAKINSTTPALDASTTGTGEFNVDAYTGTTDGDFKVVLPVGIVLDGTTDTSFDVQYAWGDAELTTISVSANGTTPVTIIAGITATFSTGTFNANDTWTVNISKSVTPTSVTIGYKYVSQSTSSEQTITAAVNGTPITLMDGLDVTINSGTYYANDTYLAEVTPEVKATVLQFTYMWVSENTPVSMNVPIDGNRILLNKGIEINFTPGMYNNNDLWEQDIIAEVALTELAISWKLTTDSEHSSWTDTTILCDGTAKEIVAGVTALFSVGVYNLNDNFRANLFAAGTPVDMDIRYKYASQTDAQYQSLTISNDGNPTPLIDGIQILFLAGMYYQNDIFLIDVAASKPYAPSATVVSKDYGSWTRSIQVKQENGTLTGTKKLTINQIGTEAYEIYDNIGAVMTVKYNGTYAYADLQILQNTDGVANRVVTRIGDTKQTATVDLDIDLTISSFATTKQLADYISSFAGYTASTINGSDLYTPTGTLDKMIATAITGYDNSQAGLVLTAYWYAVDKVVNATSRLVNVIKASSTAIIPQNFNYITLNGGTDGISPTSWEKYFEKLSNYRVTYIVALTADRVIQEELKTHVEDMSNNHDKERFAFVGGGIGLTSKACADLAYSFNSDRIELVYPGFYDYNAKGELELLPSYMTAAMAAGRACYKGVAESMTFDSFNVPALEFELSIAEVEELLKAGVAPFETIIGDIGKSSTTRLVMDKTTWTRDNNSLYTERSVRLLADYLNQRMRREVEAMAIGKKGVRLTLSSVHTRILSILSEAVRNDEIVEFRNVVTKYRNKVLSVDYEAAPVETINFALITGHFYIPEEIVITDNIGTGGNVTQ